MFVLWSACEYLENMYNFRTFGALGGLATGYTHSKANAKKFKENYNNTLHFKIYTCMIHVLTHLSLTTSLGDRFNSYYPHFATKKHVQREKNYFLHNIDRHRGWILNPVFLTL